MPIYEYTCRACGHTFEHLARRLSEPAPKCPACGAARPQKQFSVFSASAGKSAGGALPCSSGACPSGACSTRAAPCAGGACPLG